MATYEEQLMQLEKIVSDIEQGEMSVDKLTEQVGKAGQLLTALREQLTKVENEVGKVLQNIDSNEK